MRKITKTITKTITTTTTTITTTRIVTTTTTATTTTAAAITHQLCCSVHCPILLKFEEEPRTEASLRGSPDMTFTLAI